MRERLENYRILVTGGAGFIGSNLVEKLLRQGNEVVCLDNLSTGSRDNISGFSDIRNFSFIEGDLRDAATCLKVCDGIDYVLHNAALVSVPRSLDNPLATLGNNVLGTINVFDAARLKKVRRVVYASSSSVYGDSKSLPKKEAETGRPLSPYAASKFTNEYFAELYARVYGINTVGLRYFNVYGARQNPDSQYSAVIPKFISALARHERPVIYGNGSSTRDFTYVDNVIQAIQRAALFQSKGNDGFQSNQLSAVFNVACGERTDLNTLFHLIRGNMSIYDGRTACIEPVYAESRNGDIPHSHADISSARMLLGYDPEVRIEEGIKRTVEWYWNRFHNIRS